MTRSSADELREHVKSELLKTTNQARFCYLGYAPPLCIGDPYNKAPVLKESENPTSKKPPMAVPHPKHGEIFSYPQPLCVGDLYPGSLIVRIQNKEKEKKDPFRPVGVAPRNLLGRIEYVSSPETSAVGKRKESTFRKPFIPLGVRKGDSFTPNFEYISTVTDEKSRQEIAQKPDPRGPFKVSPGSASIPPFVSISVQISPSVPKQVSGEEKRNVVPFKPGGGHVAPQYPEYMSPVIARNESLSMNDKTGRRLKLGSPDIITSPIPSVMYMNLKLSGTF